MSLDKVLGALGKTFIGAGVLVFLFIAYQLWGTSITEARNQNRLESEAAQLFAKARTGPETPSTVAPGQTVPPNTTPPPPPAPAGAAVAVIQIPKIDLEKAVVEGTAVSDLKRGPGHYTNTPLPGQPGNSAIAGHRTTYGAPFGRLDELNPGDDIIVTTRQGTFTYKVRSQRIVSPYEVEVLDPTNDNRLTLTTCHPRYSAAQRLIVVAELVPGAAPAPAAPAQTTTTTTTTAPKPGATTAPAPSRTATSIEGDLSGTAVSKTPAVIWGLLTALIAIAIALAARLWRRWPAYLAGAPIFLISLFIFFENFARLLPANA